MAMKINVTDVAQVDAEDEFVLIHAEDALRGSIEIKIPTAQFWVVYRSVTPEFAPAA